MSHVFKGYHIWLILLLVICQVLQLKYPILFVNGLVLFQLVFIQYVKILRYMFSSTVPRVACKAITNCYVSSAKSPTQYVLLSTKCNYDQWLYGKISYVLCTKFTCLSVYMLVPSAKHYVQIIFVKTICTKYLLNLNLFRFSAKCYLKVEYKCYSLSTQCYL